MPSEIHPAGTPSPLRGVVVAIDGRSGAGKTVLSAELVARVGAYATEVSMDSLYAGWDGLGAGVEQAAALAWAQHHGSELRYRPWSWEQSTYDATVVVGAAPVLIIEGVGSGARAVQADLTIWLEAPADVRRHRAEARGDFGDHWSQWATSETDHLVREQTSARADVVIHTGTRAGSEDLEQLARRILALTERLRSGVSLAR